MKRTSPMTRRRLIAAMLGLAAWSLVTAAANPPAHAEQLLQNADFVLGQLKPRDWFLQGQRGEWVDRDYLQIAGDPEGSDYWYYRAFVFEPGRLYRFGFRARRLDGSGSVISGPEFANRDHHDLGADWKWFGHAFRAPDRPGPYRIRLGQWHASGKVQFDAVRLLPAVPIHHRAGEFVLGEGEQIRDGRYLFAGTFDGPASNYHRTLQEATAGFNSDRWCLVGGNRVVYRFALPGCKLGKGSVRFNVNYHSRGRCEALLSTDGHTWHEAATQDEVGTVEVALPEKLLPAEVLLLRLEGAPGSSFQINRIELECDVEGKAPDMQGETLLAEQASTHPTISLRQAWLTKTIRSGSLGLEIVARNGGKQPVALEAAARWTQSPVDGAVDRSQRELKPGQSVTIPLELPIVTAGENQLAIELQPGEGRQVRLATEVYLPDYYRANYGHRIAGVEGSTSVWWCSATQKVAPQRPVPGAAPAGSPEASAAHLEAARNDREAVQVVVRPQNRLRGLTAEASALKGPGGATVPPENVRVLRVYYHFVHHPTDHTGVRDFWPDALPPLDEPFDVPGGKNQPLWILVHVPAGAAPGDYRGTLRLKAEGFAAKVPLKLHVWDFALPERNHLATAFGFRPNNVFRYHRLKSEENKRRMIDKYFQCFAEHRISPYDPTPMDPIGVQFKPEADPPGAEVDFSAFDAAMQRAVDRYNFTHFRLRVRGLGGGTFHARHEPKIGQHGIETPQYHAMFADYLKQLQGHLRDKGWLDMAYVYWFDEPAPRDYDFVAHGMQRLYRYGPGLTRMLTEEPVEPLFGLVDLWCPVSHRYDHEAAEKRRAHGDRFWWYVCCGPKAPYCTLFIDHPATELRVWLWQTWQRKITGILIWQSNYWTSRAAYPEEPQNPYEDPMGYRSGYSTPIGTKRFWGNGDGRFIYPPLSAATPEVAAPGPVLDDPVSSIRWEMLREGIEDYEMLYMLRERLAARGQELSAEQRQRYEALLEVPPEITADMTTFTTDAAPIYQRRRAVAEAIEALSR